MAETTGAGYSGKSSGAELVFRATTSNRSHVAKKRALTPARRAQNRASQARYRLKQRQLAEESTRTASHSDEDSSEVATPSDNISNDEARQDVKNTLRQNDTLTLPCTRKLGDTISIGQWHCDDMTFSGELEAVIPSDYSLASEMHSHSLTSFSMPSNGHLSATSMPSYQTKVSEGHGEKERHAILPPTPFLLINHIRLRDMTFLAATLAIAASIGVTSEDYLNDRPSPFYLFANATSTQNAAHYFEQIVKPHLRPSLTQLSQPHASYLDLIIFPHFRERAVTFATNNPCLLDQQELFNDMLSGGLTCWGNADNSIGARGSGVPWDMRSWEAKPWFIRKWWFLLNTDDEVKDTSSWWRQMRGEDGNVAESLDG